MLDLATCHADLSFVALCQRLNSFGFWAESTKKK
jgi:hypothetical protein